MTFQSILFDRAERGHPIEKHTPPDFLVDLNLDQIIASITAGKEEYNLIPFFHVSLHDLDSIVYRQDVMRDLEDTTLLGNVKSFAKALHSVREIHKGAQKFYYRYQKDALFLDAIGGYCDAITHLARDLGLADLHSRGLSSFRQYLVDYAQSDRFMSLLRETEKLKADLSTVEYSLLIKRSSITVRRYNSEIDYTVDVEESFSKFQQGAVNNYSLTFSDWLQMNHIEAGVLDCVARLYPDIFAYLNAHCMRHATYLDDVVGAFDREIQFYVGYLDYIQSLKLSGLNFCYPTLSVDSKELRVGDAFDLALAKKLVSEHATVVCNGFYLRCKERMFVVSGPNQGGKTTFARMFGQLHYLASLGCPVPGKRSHLFLFDRIFTHFEREEHIDNLRGKLQNDLVRMHEIINQATSRSIIIINEIFNSTTLRDAIFLGTNIIDCIVEIGALCVCVTFIDELSLLSDSIVSAASTIVPERPAERTYKIVRKPADGLAYALSIAEKYGLTRAQIRERIKS